MTQLQRHNQDPLMKNLPFAGEFCSADMQTQKQRIENANLAAQIQALAAINSGLMGVQSLPDVWAVNGRGCRYKWPGKDICYNGPLNAFVNHSEAKVREAMRGVCFERAKQEWQELENIQAKNNALAVIEVTENTIKPQAARLQAGLEPASEAATNGKLYTILGIGLLVGILILGYYLFKKNK